MEEERTPWFDADKHKPVRVGWYEYDMFLQTTMAYWDGDKWLGGPGLKRLELWPFDAWRGLTEEWLPDPVSWTCPGAHGLYSFAAPGHCPDCGVELTVFKREERWTHDGDPYVVFYCDHEANCRDRKDWTQLYTAPPKRPLLTDDDIAQISVECAASHKHDDFNFARAIERKVRGEE